MDHVLRQIEEAFAPAPRPSDEELLHEDCADDNDIKSLYGIPHWRDVPDQVVEYEYATLFFLSPAAFRHFLPAYMSYALRHPGTDQPAVGSTVFALTPMPEEPTRSFSLSKFSLFDGAQKAAVVAFLEVHLRPVLVPSRTRGPIASRRSASSSSMAGIRWPYVLSVVVMEAWPSRSWMAFG